MKQFHVATAAEAIAAAQFARCGWDVSVQYGANQPEYDLVAANADAILKVSVKGSQDGSWGLTQSYMEPKLADYRGAADRWYAKHSKRTVFCFVQFKDTGIHEMPRLYLASPLEVATWLKAAANGRGDTVLKERHTWAKRAHASGMTESIPDSWKFTGARISELATTVPGLG